MNEPLKDARPLPCMSMVTEEYHHPAALSVVRNRLNEPVPVAQLPVEILEHIFEICVSWLYGYQMPAYRLAWTQVCHSWRQTALNSPRLWHRIDLCNAQFANEFLIRSKSAPLSVISNSPLKLNVECLINHAERLRSIDVHLFPNDMAKLFAHIGPNLSSLTDLTLRLSPMSSCLPLDIALPSVRRLALDCVSVRWESCQNLTHLSIRCLSPELSPSLPELYSIFAKSPFLEYLRLESLMPADIEMVPYEGVSLMHLKEFIISATPSVITAVFHGMSINPCARVQFYTSLTDDLHYLFPRGVFPVERVPCSSVVGGLRLARNSAHFLRPFSPSWSNTSSHMTFSISSSTSVAMRVLSSVPYLLNPSHITALEFSTDVLSDIPTSALHFLLTGLYSLETLCLAFNELRDVLDLLIPVPSASIVCPRLSKLSFNRPGDLWWNFANCWVGPIFECVLQRHIFSVPISTLEFSRCHGLTGEFVGKLKTLVRDVRVISY